MAVDRHGSDDHAVIWNEKMLPPARPQPVLHSPLSSHTGSSDEKAVLHVDAATHPTRGIPAHMPSRHDADVERGESMSQTTVPARDHIHHLYGSTSQRSSLRGGHVVGSDAYSESGIVDNDGGDAVKLLVCITRVCPCLPSPR